MILDRNCELYNTNISSIHSNLISIVSNNEVNIHNLLINGHDASEISLEFNGAIQNSYVNGSNSESLSIHCGDSTYIENTTCNNLTVLFPSGNPNINQTNSSLTCYKYGCEFLTLYTVHGADDINITGVDCDCSHRIINACIGQWDIYCNNDYYNPSIFYNANNCTGYCCKNIMEQLHVNQCHWNPKNHKQHLEYIVIGSCLFVLCITIIAAVYCRRRQLMQREHPHDDRLISIHGTRVM
eukprot:548111_1